jgi:hypothetical protein
MRQGIDARSRLWCGAVYEGWLWSGWQKVMQVARLEMIAFFHPLGFFQHYVALDFHHFTSTTQLIGLPLSALTYALNDRG